MSKTARLIGTIAAVVAIVATAGAALGVVLGGTMMFAGVSASTIAAVASAVAAGAGMIAQATMKPPDMRGSVSQVIIGNNLPIILALGITYVGGHLIYDKAAPPADNKNRTQIMVVSAAGPIESFEALQADYTTITFSTSGSGLISGVASGHYGADGGYMWANSRKGLRPDTALTPFAGRPDFREWGTDYKLSGYAAYSVTMEFDEDGIRYAAGIPQFGVIIKATKQYDPRLDSTYPGGSGTCRFNDESSFVFGTGGVGTVAPGENPALQALTYARGRFIEKDAGGTPITPVKIAGAGLPWDSIRVQDFVELANLCDANGWKSGGAIYEAPGMSKWDNLKRILATCAAEPVWTGGQLGVKFSAPKTSLGTITASDLADGDVEIVAMKSWRDKVNTVVPRVRLETHKWEYEQLDAVTDSTYLTEDGEAKTREVQYDLCQDKDQGAELAAYTLVNSREFGPIRIPVKPAFMVYRPGEALTVDLESILGDPALGTQLCIITARQVDPATGAVLLTLESETTAKHAFALGRTGVAPPTPTIVSSEEIDLTVADQNQAIFHMPDIAPVVIEADHTGTVLSGQLPRNVFARMFQGSTDVTVSTAWARAVDSGSITSTIGAATGVLNITAIGTAEAVVTITGTYGGVVKSRKVKITRNSAAVPTTGGGGGTSATDTSFATINSATMAAITDELTVTVGSAGVVTLSAPLAVGTPPSGAAGALEVLGRWQWWDGGAWVDQGAGETASDPDCTVTIDPDTLERIVDEGALSVSASKTGLTPSSSQKFRLRARNSSGTRVMGFSGTASAVAS